MNRKEVFFFFRQGSWYHYNFAQLKKRKKKKKYFLKKYKSYTWKKNTETRWEFIGKDKTKNKKCKKSFTYFFFFKSYRLLYTNIAKSFTFKDITRSNSKYVADGPLRIWRKSIMAYSSQLFFFFFFFFFFFLRQVSSKNIDTHFGVT